MHFFYRLVETLTKSPNLCRSVVAVRLSVSNDYSEEPFTDHIQLITLLPSLKQLTLSPPPPHLSLPTSNRLETLRFDFDDYSLEYTKDTPELDRVHPIELVARHFWMATLQSLRLHSGWLYHGPWSHLFPKERYRTSPISDLRVMGCVDPAIGVLADILLSVRRLRRFTLESTVIPPLVDSTDRRFSPNWFAQALQPHESTLVDLVITGCGETAFLSTPIFGSMASYVSLKKLGILETFLVQRDSRTLHEWLPVSLEVLQLQFPFDRDMVPPDEEQPLRFQRMKYLAENKCAYLPSLKCVIWWAQEVKDWYIDSLLGDRDLDRIDQLARLFKDVGVEFKLCCCKLFYETPMSKESGWGCMEEVLFD